MAPDKPPAEQDPAFKRFDSQRSLAAWPAIFSFLALVLWAGFSLQDQDGMAQAVASVTR